MTKAQTLTKKEKKEPNMGVKDGLVIKNKSQKFKVTPISKLLLNKISQNGNNTNGSFQSLPKSKNKLSYNKNKLKIKNELECDNESFEDSDGTTKNNTNKNKGLKMFGGLKNVKDNSEVNNEEDDSVDDEAEGEDCSSSLKALLGDSIADDDDEDFNEDNASDDDEDISDDDDEDISDDNDKDISDDNDEDISDDNDDKIILNDYAKKLDNEDEKDESEDEDSEDIGLKALLDESLIDEDDDDDFKGDIDEEDDDDISDESEEDIEKVKCIKESKSSNKVFLVEKQEKSSKIPRLNKNEQIELDARTIYVGNVPIDTPAKTIEQLFRSCGEIDNIRIRGVAPDDSRTSFKSATISKTIHSKVNSIYVYVVFKDKASVEEALKLNGYKFGNNILRVDLSTFKKNQNHKKSVFVGNLPFDITDDEMRAHFTSCGNIESVRVVRNRLSGLSRGIGYINFMKEDSVNLALELNGTLLKNCKIRVQIYCLNPKGKKRKYRVTKKQNDSKKKFKNNKSKDTIITPEKKINEQKKSQKIKRKKLNKSEINTLRKEDKMNISFQGQKADIKKKFKINKMDKKKKIMADKLTTLKKSTNITN